MNPRRVKPYEYPYSQEESQAAHEAWGANCGPGALATMVGLKLDDVRSHIPQFEQRGYTNPSMMQAALRSLGVKYHEVDDTLAREAGSVLDPGYKLIWPKYGLMRIQWEGRWMNPGVPIAARYRHTHWVGIIATDQPNIFDCNFGWGDYIRWVREVVGPITSQIKGANGKFHPTHCWELEL